MKKFFILVNNDSNTLDVVKMKDQLGGVAIAEYVGLRPKTYLILVSSSSEYKKYKRCQ